MSRLIPKNEVWKFIFEVSHAPIYIMQLDTEDFIGMYAPVENVPGDNSVPARIEEAKVTEYVGSDHIDRIKLDKSETPFNSGVVHTQIIPPTKAWKFTFQVDTEDITKDTVEHYVVQLDNGSFIYDLSESSTGPVGLAKENVLAKKSDPKVQWEEVSLRESPF